MALPKRDRELVQIMNVALAEAARKAGAWLVCREVCTQCCYGTFAINELDAARLEQGMEILRREDPSLAAEIERRAASWIAEHGPAFPGDRETGCLGTSDAERRRFESFADDAPCPALDPLTGRCDVYAWRPMTCRVFGPPVRSASLEGEEGIAHCELCFAGASNDEIAACEMRVPHDLERELLEEIAIEGETVVAYALLRKSQK
jgi:Fe-S-cluster containining protein